MNHYESGQMFYNSHWRWKLHFLAVLLTRPNYLLLVRWFIAMKPTQLSPLSKETMLIGNSKAHNLISQAGGARSTNPHTVTLWQNDCRSFLPSYVDLAQAGWLEGRCRCSSRDSNPPSTWPWCS